MTRAVQGTYLVSEVGVWAEVDTCSGVEIDGVCGPIAEHALSVISDTSAKGFIKLRIGFLIGFERDALRSRRGVPEEARQEPPEYLSRQTCEE